MLPSNLLLLHLLHSHGQLPRLFLLTPESLLVFPILLIVLSLEPVLLLLNLPLTSLLPLLLFEVANESLARDLLALKALPDALGHALQIRAEQMVWLCASTASDEIARILALEAVFRVLIIKNTIVRIL